MATPIPQLSVREGLARYRSDRLGLLQQLADDDLPIVESTLGPVRLVIITDADLSRELLVKNAAKLVKGPAISKYAKPILGNGLLSAEGAEHRRQRKILAPKFKPRHMDRYAGDIVAETETMFGRWRDGPAPSDFGTEMIHLTMAIAAKTMFGTTLGAVVDTVSDALDVGNRYITSEATSLLHIPSFFPTRRNQELKRALAKLDAVIWDMIDQHRKGGEDLGDVLSVLLRAKDEAGVGLRDEIIRDEVVTFFLAGHETTANALSWAYPLLCDNPEVVSELRAEVSRVVGDRQLVFEDVAKLPFAAKVFKEVIRLYPPSYMMGRQATEEFDLGGYRIRNSSYLLVNSYGLHRLAKNFTDPETFCPQRFDNESEWPKLAFAAFGAGSRVCIGTHFAMMEGVLILAMLAQNIEFRDSGFVYEAEPLITLRPRNGVPFSLQWRAAEEPDADE